MQKLDNRNSIQYTKHHIEFVNVEKTAKTGDATCQKQWEL